jgi:alpha-tubulin suppressor-like RCC1 family protein
MKLINPALFRVGALTNWAQVSAGSDAHTAAVKTDGTIWTWGRNSNGRLGDDTTVNKSSPVQIGALTNWSQVSAGLGHTASIKTDGTVWAWGYNTDGQIGDGTVVAKSSPVQIGALTNWSQVSAGGTHVVAIVQETTN